MFGSFKDVLTKIKYGLLAAALAAPAIGQATPAAAAGASITITPATSNIASVAAGANITLTVNADPGGATIRGWQFGLTWNPAVVSLNQADVVYSDAFLNSQKPAGANIFNNPGTVSSGALSGGGDSYLGGTGGATAVGVLATVTFHAVANGTSGIALTTGGNGSFLVDSTNTNVATTLNNASIQIGPVAGPNLVIQNPATVATTTPAGATFNVTFTVANTGTLASTAGTATVTVTNATPATATVPVGILAAGANSGMLTAGVFTLTAGQTLAGVTITDGSATATTAYSFAAFNSNGTTSVNATYGGFLQLTAPGLESAAFTAGKTNEFGGTSPKDDLNVKSNLSTWTVSASGTDTGHFHEFDPGTSADVTGGAQLLQDLSIRTDATLGPLGLTGTPQVYATGTRATTNASTGNTFTITYDQFVGFNDAPVNAPRIYHITITWAAAGTF